MEQFGELPVNWEEIFSEQTFSNLDFNLLSPQQNTTESFCAKVDKTNISLINPIPTSEKSSKKRKLCCDTELQNNPCCNAEKKTKENEPCCDSENCGKLGELAQKSPAYNALLNVFINETDFENLCLKLISFLQGHFQCSYGAIYFSEPELYIAYTFPTDLAKSNYFSEYINPTITNSLQERIPYQINLNSNDFQHVLVTPLFSDSSDEGVAIVLGGSSQFQTTNTANFLLDIQHCLGKTLILRKPSTEKLLKPKDSIENLRLENEKLYEKNQYNENMMFQLLSMLKDTAVICTSTKGLITNFNIGASLLLGYECNEMIGKKSILSILDLTEVSNRSSELKPIFGQRISPFTVLIEFAKAKKLDSVEWNCNTKDGHQKRMKISSRPICSNNHVVAFIHTANNV